MNELETGRKLRGVRLSSHSGEKTKGRTGIQGERSKATLQGKKSRKGGRGHRG